MSSIKKGIKKVFKSVKKVAKKFAKPALIIAGTLFTAGVVSGGFSAFQGLAGAGTITDKISGFMGAVGKTIAQGANTLTGGMFGGGSGVDTTQKQLAGLDFSDPNYAAQKAAILASAGPEKRGFLGNVLGAIGNFASTDTGKMVIAQGIMGGIQSYAAARQADQERRRFNKETVFGVQRQGSGGQSLLSARLPELAGPNQQMPSNEQYMPGAPPQSDRSLLAQNVQATPAPTDNLSPAWGGPQMMPIQGNIDMSYMQQGQQQPQPLLPLRPNYG